MHNEKGGFFGKGNNAGKHGRQQEKRKSRHEMNCWHKRNHGHEFTGAEWDG